MTKQIIVLIFISLFIAGCDRNSQKEITKKKKKYSLISLDSDKILFDKTTNLLSQNHNKPYLLVFLSTWCDYCLGQAQHIANMHEEFGDKINIYGVFLDRDEKEDELKKFVRQSNTKFKWFYKGDIAMLIDTYQIKTLPFILLFDKNGNLVMSYNGITPEEMITFNIKKLL